MVLLLGGGGLNNVQSKFTRLLSNIDSDFFTIQYGEIWSPFRIKYWLMLAVTRVLPCLLRTFEARWNT